MFTGHDGSGQPILGADQHLHNCNCPRGVKSVDLDGPMTQLSREVVTMKAQDPSEVIVRNCEESAVIISLAAHEALCRRQDFAESNQQPRSQCVKSRQH